MDAKGLLLFIMVGVMSLSPFSVVADDYVKLKVKQSDEGASIPVEIPEDRLSEMRRAMVEFSKALSECATASGEYTNPLIARTSTYKTKPSSLGCTLTLNSHSVRTYKCFLPESKRKRFASAMLKRTLSDEVIGDYSQGEKEILFDERLCTTE